MMVFYLFSNFILYILTAISCCKRLLFSFTLSIYLLISLDHQNKLHINVHLKLPNPKHIFILTLFTDIFIYLYIFHHVEKKTCKAISMNVLCLHPYLICINMACQPIWGYVTPKRYGISFLVHSYLLFCVVV